MSTPEDIPEDRVQQFLCDCGGNIEFDKNTQCHECDTCDFKKEETNGKRL